MLRREEVDAGRLEVYRQVQAAKRRGSRRMSAMPVYEFNCTKCSERFEVMGSYAEREKEHTCPKCGSTEVKQAISLFSAAPPRSY
jgi:putative FmdB family regulatory protein